MKTLRHSIAFAASACLLLNFSTMSIGSADSTLPPPLTKEEANYLLGVNYGVVMRNYDVGMEILPDVINRGFVDGLSGKRKATPDEQRRIREFIASVQPIAAQIHAAAAREFLEHNLHEKGVVSTPSGLQYKILVKGDARGVSPKPQDFVSVKYRGTLADGTEFDNTFTRTDPLTMPLNGTVKGWQEALTLMRPGAKWQLIVPPELGYGAAPRPGIPGNSVLIFEVELYMVTPHR
jgi:FKBP-type peptidyl-prolyl cis-trans isomerase